MTPPLPFELNDRVRTTASTLTPGVFTSKAGWAREFRGSANEETYVVFDDGDRLWIASIELEREEP